MESCPLLPQLNTAASGASANASRCGTPSGLPAHHSAGSNFTVAESVSMPNLLTNKSASSSSQSTKVGSQKSSAGTNGKVRSTRLPLCQESKGLQDLYRVVKELAALWEETSAPEEQRLTDTEAFSAVAIGELLRHVEASKQRQTSLEERCRVLRIDAQDKLEKLADQIDSVLWNELSVELQAASDQKLVGLRFAALLKVDEKLSSQVQYVQELREAVAEAMRVLGLDPSQVSGGVAELEAAMADLKQKLLERRSRALGLLGETGGDIDAKDQVEYLRFLTADVQGLEVRLGALQAGAMQAAFRARSLWEEVGESPQQPRDSHAFRLSADRKPSVLAEDESCINSIEAAAVAASLSAWEDRRDSAASELTGLHRALRSFGSSDVVEPFIKDHASVHKTHREACQQKLYELLAQVRASEAPALNALRHLYEVSGLGSEAFEAFVASLDSAACMEARAQMIVQETKRVERYLESIAKILGPLAELKALVEAAVAFEANVQAGKNRFAGNALHFLEEEKFRRRFGHDFPDLRDGLIEAISVWEAHVNKKFIYHGFALREGLVGLQSLPVNLVKVPGDLSSVEQVVQMLKLTEPPPAPAARRKANRSHSQPPSARSSSRKNISPSSAASSRVTSPSGSPARQSRRAGDRPKKTGSSARRAKSVGQLIQPPLMPAAPAPAGPGRLLLPKPPRFPEGAGGGNPACMAAVHLASEIRLPMRGQVC